MMEKRAASGSEDFTVKLWDTKKGKEKYGENYVKVATFSLHTKEIERICFSPDDKYLISGSADKSLIVWNTKNAKPVSVLKGHNGSVKDCAFTDDGKYIITGSTDSSLIVWDSRNFNVIVSFSCLSRLCGLDTHHVNFKQVVACGDGSGVLYILTPIGFNL